MPHVDEGLLHALLDEEPAAFDPGEEAAVRRHLAECGECRARLEEARAIRERAHALLRGGDPVGVSLPPFEALAARPASPRRPRRLATLAWAASLVLALAAGWLARSALRSPGAGGEPRARVAGEPRAAPAPTIPTPVPAADATPAVAPTSAPARPAKPVAASRSGPAPRTRVAAREVGPARDGPGTPAESPASGRGEPRLPERPAASALDSPSAAPPPPAPAAPEGAAPSPEAGRRMARARAASPAPREARPPSAIDASAPLALEGLVVTASGTSREAVPGTTGWRSVRSGEAQRILGRDPLRVPGLAVVSIRTGLLEGREAIEVRQALGEGEELSLVQVRGLTVAATPPPWSAAVVWRVEDINIIASAPLSAESLTALLEQLR